MCIDCQWCTGSEFWSPIRPDIKNFLDLDWISFLLQPEPDYPIEKSATMQKKLILTNSCIRKNYYIWKSATAFFSSFSR